MGTSWEVSSADLFESDQKLLKETLTSFNITGSNLILVIFLECYKFYN